MLSVGPSSTPAEIHHGIRSHKKRATPKSCLMKTTLTLTSQLIIFKRLRICARAETSSLETASSATDQLGANPQVPRDRNPLQLASRERMRKTPRLIARQTDPLEKLADFRLKVFAATNAMPPKRQRDRVSNPEAWIERREWVLKHQLQIATMLPLLLPLRGQPLRTRYDRSLPVHFRGFFPGSSCRYLTRRQVR